MDARHVGHWGTLTIVALFSVTGVEVRATVPATDAAASSNAKTVEVLLICFAKGYRFEPSTVTFLRGEKVRFKLV